MKKKPTADDFVRMMEALSAFELANKDNDIWGKIYRLAHVCFKNPCTHPSWEREFWKTYNEVKIYWKAKEAR